MGDLIKILESFNRKERFYLLTYALGKRSGCEELTFKLDEDNPFWSDLRHTLCVPEPKGEVFLATDYHLNWIHASLYAAKCGIKPQCKIPGRNSTGDCLTKNSQQDVDLLIAFENDGTNYLVFLEAKGYDADGYARFDKRELKEKLGRLNKILEYNRAVDGPKVKPRFCLMSGKKPDWLDDLRKQLKSSDIEIQPEWLELPLPKCKWVVKSLKDPLPIVTEICK